MSRETYGPTYKDKQGKTVVVTAGLDGTYIVARIKPNGSASRVKSQALEAVTDMRQVNKIMIPALAKYAAEKGWGRIEQRPDDAAPGVQVPDETVNGEVLPPVLESASPAPQDEYAERIVNLHVAAGQHASAAVFCAAAAGAVMLQRKKALGWGKGFTTWKESLMLPDGRKLAPTTADRYMALAKELETRIKTIPTNSPLWGNLLPPGSGSEDSANSQLVANSPTGQVSMLELLASYDPATVSELRRQAITEALQEVTNERSLTQLYFAWGIVKPPTPRGGDHGGGAAMHERSKHSNQLEILNAHEQWQLIIQYFREFSLQKKRYVHVPPAAIEAGLESIRECIRALPKEK